MQEGHSISATKAQAPTPELQAQESPGMLAEQSDLQLLMHLTGQVRPSPASEYVTQVCQHQAA